MNDVQNTLNTFFKKNREMVEASVSAVAPNALDEILKLKDNFDAEKNKKGGCSACRLRGLMRKYTPLVEKLIRENK